MNGQTPAAPSPPLHAESAFVTPHHCAPGSSVQRGDGTWRGRWGGARAGKERFVTLPRALSWRIPDQGWVSTLWPQPDHSLPVAQASHSLSLHFTRVFSRKHLLLQSKYFEMFQSVASRTRGWISAAEPDVDSPDPRSIARVPTPPAPSCRWQEDPINSFQLLRNNPLAPLTFQALQQREGKEPPSLPT